MYAVGISKINAPLNGTIGIVPPMAELDVIIADKTIMGRVDARPMYAVIYLHPCVSFAALESQSRHIAAAYPLQPQQRQQDMGIVLTYSAVHFHSLLRGSLRARDSPDVRHSIIQTLRKLLRP